MKQKRLMHDCLERGIFCMFALFMISFWLVDVHQHMIVTSCFAGRDLAANFISELGRFHIKMK